MPAKILYAIFIVVSLGLIVGVPFLWLRAQEPQPAIRLLFWGLSMLGLAIFVFTVGYSIKNKVLGALIDERNQMSLSRLQLIIWTIIVISAYCDTLVLPRLARAPCYSSLSAYLLWLATLPGLRVPAGRCASTRFVARIAHGFH